MGFGASKPKNSSLASPTKAASRSPSETANPRVANSSPSDQAAAGQHRNCESVSDTSVTPSTQENSRDTESPAGTRGFNNPQPARRETAEGRGNLRQTRMVGAENMNGGKEDLDERPFRQEKVSRVPTKALLKPPKDPNSMIADPDGDEYDLL